MKLRSVMSSLALIGIISSSTVKAETTTNPTIINATILQSVNLQDPHTYYRPKFSEISFIEDEVKKKLNMAAVYTGEFNIDPVDPIYTDLNSREYEVLGRDIVLESESYTKGKYTSKEMDRDSVTRENAIMALYKALGENQYKVDLYPTAVANHVDINSSPLLYEVKSPNVLVNKNSYFTKVFITRTLPTRYWNKSVEDGIVLGTTSENYKKEEMTIGEFSRYVSDLLNLKGEEVITDKEEQQLLVTYGRNIPYYLSSTEVDAIKYLMARGIVDDTLDFKAKIDRETMLSILSRAKDEASRLTFKKLDIPYISSLVEGGFYPTDTVIEDSPITSINWEDTTSTSSIYDYYVKVIKEESPESKSTVFKRNNSKINNNLFVSSTYSGEKKVQYPGSQYLGIKEGYYHFRVPISILQNSDAIRCINPEGRVVNNTKCYYDPSGDSKNKAYINITSTSNLDSPSNIKVEFGGGIYLTAESTEEKKTSKMDRQEFTPDFSNLLVDRERKISSMGDIEKPVPLSNNSETTVTFTATDLTRLLWDGKPLSKLMDSKGLPSLTKGEKSNEYKIKLDATDPYKELMSYLTTTKTGQSVGQSPAYVRDDKVALVSLSYLKRNNMIESVVKLNKGKYMLYSDTSNILIDTVNRLIVAGQSVTEIPETDTSPLIITNPGNGEYLIDARAVMGIANNVLLIKSSNGSVNVTFTGNKTSLYQSKRVIPLLGEDTDNRIKAVTKDKKTRVYLEDSYPISNFLVYRSRTKGTNEDYLLVFKPKLTNINSGLASKNKAMLKSKFKIALGEDEVVSIYPLNKNVEYQSGSERPSDIKSDNNGYYLLPKEAENFSYTGYLKSARGSSTIPIVQKTKNGETYLLDFNMNILQSKESKGWYPKTIISRSAQLVLTDNAKSMMMFNTGGSGYSFTTSSVSVDGILATPAGVQGKYFPLTKVDWDTLTDKNASVYFGSMKAKVSKSLGTGTDMYTMKVGTNLVKEVPMALAQKDVPFNEIFRGTRSRVYLYSVDGQSKLLDFKESGKDSDSLDPTVKQGSKNIFDWLAYKFRGEISEADDFLTIAIIFLLNVVPRLMLFLIFSVATLSLIADNKLIILFCEKFFDIYRVLSLGILNIHSIDKRTIWISTFIGVVLLSLLNSGQILEVFAWISRAIHGIMNR